MMKEMKAEVREGLAEHDRKAKEREAKTLAERDKKAMEREAKTLSEYNKKAKEDAAKERAKERAEHAKEAKAKEAELHRQAEEKEVQRDKGIEEWVAVGVARNLAEAHEWISALVCRVDKLTDKLRATEKTLRGVLQERDYARSDELEKQVQWARRNELQEAQVKDLVMWPGTTAWSPVDG
ncbi:hypothetical protein DXG01_015862 [Tephrocybe rancida]|nr:hypothetical protein DXG01_015862 [Tephrocybe rancida]